MGCGQFLNGVTLYCAEEAKCGYLISSIMYTALLNKFLVKLYEKKKKKL